MSYKLILANLFYLYINASAQVLEDELIFESATSFLLEGRNEKSFK
tara:strand:+ start:6132 stop:6269 length:138 start_codon:yes stop_codon:yes gene_type:complete